VFVVSRKNDGPVRRGAGRLIDPKSLPDAPPEIRGVRREPTVDQSKSVGHFHGGVGIGAEIIPAFRRLFFEIPQAGAHGDAQIFPVQIVQEFRRPVRGKAN